MIEGLIGLNILASVIDLWLTEALPFLVLLGVICGVISFFYDFLKPFIGFNRY